MRFRKERGKKLPQVALSENEIVQACHDYLEAKGYTLADISHLVIPIRDKVDKRGRKVRRGIEFRAGIKEFREPSHG